MEGSLSQRSAVARQAATWREVAARRAPSSASGARAAASAAVRTVVWRMVRAWKKAQRFEASTLRDSASVYALFAPVSAIASIRASTAISSATRLFSPE